MSDFNQLRKANTKRGKEWNNGKECELISEELLFRSNELGGEAGELQNAVKKLVRHMNSMVGGVNFQESIPHIADEAGDVVICVDRVCELLGIDLENAVQCKFNKTSVKHGFDILL